MMPESEQPAEKPGRSPLTINDGLGCVTVIVAFLVCSAIGGMFSSGSGDVWKVIGAIVLGLFGLGAVWVCARYRD